MIAVLLRLYVLFFARQRFVKFNTVLYNVGIRGLGVYNYEDMNVSGENYFIDKYIFPLASKKSKFIVFDVGANQGEYSMRISQINNVDVYAFEPHPRTFMRLRENTRSLPSIKCFNSAVSDTVGEIELFDYENADGSAHASLNAEIFSTVHRSKVTSHIVDVTTIDTVVRESRLNRIDFLKIDVEGHELDVLKGASQILQEKNISIIQFEFTQLNSTTRVFFKDFYDLLSGNYAIYRLLPEGMIWIDSYNPTSHEIFGYQNYVAILKE